MYTILAEKSRTEKVSLKMGKDHVPSHVLEGEQETRKKI